ncbi:alpha/beta fold hydrolase [Nitratireductor sp. GISD-1A_MAKvit]|uniref:alpha/beta fold hydrolase n=1 Tax=Nitratireductor sp. GISD-1A_MAKvit TaxID=3234198 RepID=UPI00346546DD
MSFVFIGRFCFSFLFVIFSVVAAQAFELASHKDRLFAYPAVLSSGEGGAYRVVDYQELRDINGRDAVPERRVEGRYVSTGVRRFQQDLALRTDAGTVRHFAVGKTRQARAIVLYLHGQGGNRRQGVNDFSFGGNFNRIKNLMAKSGGLYLSPDIPDFRARGTAQIAALIAHYAAQSPGAPVFVACGSMGGALCWQLARHEDTARRLGGLLLLGSMWDEGFFQSPAIAARVPVFFGHGSEDRVFPVETQEAFFRKIRSAAKGYPARFVRFETGTHGTPIRMTDWRETLNWMLTGK